MKTTRIGKSISHVYDDKSLKFGEILHLLEHALRGSLSSVVGNIYEKTDGQNVLLTFDDNGPKLRTGGTILDDDILKEKYQNKESVYKIYKNCLEQFKELHEKKVISKHAFDNGNVYLNLEIIDSTNTNVIWYSDVPMLQAHSFTSFKEKSERVDWTLGVDNVINELSDYDDISKQYFQLLKPNKIYFERGSENSSVVWGITRNKLDRLMHEYNLTPANTLLDYYVEAYTKFINKKLPNLSNETKTHLIKRWSEYKRSHAINSKTIAEKNYLNEIKKLDIEAWEYSNQLKDELKKIVLFAGTHTLLECKGILCVDEKKSLDKFKKAFNEIANEMFVNGTAEEIKEYQKNYKILNSAGGLDKYRPIEGIVFEFKNKIYKLTGVFTPINQMMGIIKYRRNN